MSIINETLKQLERSGRDPSLLARMPKNANAAPAAPEASSKPWLWLGLPVLFALLLWQWWPLVSSWIAPNHGQAITPAMVATSAAPEQPLAVAANASENTTELAADRAVTEAMLEPADSADQAIAVAAAPVAATTPTVTIAAAESKASVAVAAAPVAAATPTVTIAAAAPKASVAVAAAPVAATTPTLTTAAAAPKASVAVAAAPVAATTPTVKAAVAAPKAKVTEAVASVAKAAPVAASTTRAPQPASTAPAKAATTAPRPAAAVAATALDIRPSQLDTQEQALRRWHALRGSSTRGAGQRDAFIAEAYAILEMDEQLHDTRLALIQQLPSAQAQSKLTKALARFPQQGSYTVLQAEQWHRQGQLAQAKQWIERGQNQGLLLEASWLGRRAQLAQQLQLHQAAASDWQQLVQLEPQQVNAWLSLGYNLEFTGARAQAGHAYRQALAWPGLAEESRQYVQQRLQHLDQAL